MNWSVKKRCLAEAEAAERKAKAEKERLEMERQLGLLQRNSNEDVNVESRVEASRAKAIIVLPSMHEKEDPISYFHSFEKVARLHNINQSESPKLLPSLLNSTLRQHYNCLSCEVCSDFIRTKAEILTACQMNPRLHLDKFRTMHHVGKETNAQFLCRLSDVQEYYL